MLLPFGIPFLVLFNSFPAGMVLDCTSNNLFALARDEPSRCVDELETSPERLVRHWMYFESSYSRFGERLLNRIENSAPFHTELAALLQGERRVEAVSPLIGELWSPLPAETLEAVEVVLYPMEPSNVADPPNANARLEKPARTASGSKRSRGSRPNS